MVGYQLIINKAIARHNKRHPNERREIMQKTFLRLTGQEWLTIGGQALVAVAQIALIAIGKENPIYAPVIQTVLVLLGKIVL